MNNLINLLKNNYENINYFFRFFSHGFSWMGNTGCGIIQTKLEQVI